MIWIRDVECPDCNSHDDVTVDAILSGTKAVLEFVCEACRKRFFVNSKANNKKIHLTKSE